MTAAPSTEWKTEPFRFGTPEQFARLRDLFRRTGYTEKELCDRFQISAIQDFRQARDGRPELPGPNDAQALLVRLFMDVEDVARTDTHSTLGEDVATIEALGLLEQGLVPDSVTGTVLLYPMEQLWIVSDRNIDPRNARIAPPPDVVYPAIAKNTQRFIGLMPRSPVNRYLELCSGTGIAALLAATGFAKHAWAIDITERATRFARFNAMLNDVTNFTALEGDLYAPVLNETFDRIVAHPPYMPALEDEYIFRDGGEDGERVTWNILRGLADHLNPGGDFFCDCLSTDRENAPMEMRIREALGPGNGEFDILVGQMQRLDPAPYYADLAKQGRQTYEMLGRRLEVFRRLEIEALVFSTIIIRRGQPGHTGVTVRRMLAPTTTTSDLFALLDWKSRTVDWGIEERRSLLNARLKLNPKIQLRMVNFPAEEGWALGECMLAMPHPFQIESVCPPWFPRLLIWFDGRMRAGEHFEHLKDSGTIPAEASEDEFAGMIFNLVDAGYATIVDDPLASDL